MKVGDKVRRRDSRRNEVHEVLAVHGDHIWVDDRDTIPFTTAANAWYLMPEEIEAGQVWRYKGDGIHARVIEVTPGGYVIYHFGHKPYGPNPTPRVRTEVSFREVYEQ
jgi:hypothetical protein